MKGIKRTSHFLKQYFVFSKSERNGIYVLLFLIALALFAPKVYRLINPPQPTDFSITTFAADQPNNSVFISDSTNQIVEQQQANLFFFNPNTIDSANLVSLGFTSKSARSIVNYRNKGGKFKQPEDLYRIFNVDSNFITTLLPYVQLDKQEEYQSQFKPNQFISKEIKAFVPVELNTADSLQLVSLYGIGPKMASKIIDYRNRLGGFFRVEQLTEIWGIDEFLLEELNGKIYVDVSKVKYLPINSITYDELKLNPYLRFKIASAIVNYRKHHGTIKRIEDLKQVILLPDSTYLKLLPYLKLD
jgi:competence ComEA-like helix-hairpin-helix protein